MRRTYSRSEAVGLLQALERQLREAAQLSAVAQKEAARQSFIAYQQFRDKVGEFKALCILVESRIRNLAEGRKDDLQAEYERLDTLMLALLVKASMKFFFVLSANTVLPLGAREIFISELRSLYDAHEKLRNPNLQERLDANIRNDLETAEAILEEIIDKAPSLLQFSGTPA
ncbi:hypothetical protein [Arenibaculum pallidiluteum]|uniref:hypothetical protein n=1 Tax=Arenibaculum pallidiluteum TaxID=2812559 RepID=UPI002E2CA3C8|nr:hypothetical protein [Arenibaculum pallidiluteum]